MTTLTTAAALRRAVDILEFPRPAAEER